MCLSQNSVAAMHKGAANYDVTVGRQAGEQEFSLRFSQTIRILILKVDSRIKAVCKGKCKRIK